MGVGRNGMTNVALSPRPSSAAVYCPDFGYYQMELLPTQPCADPRALMFSEFVSLLFLIFSLTYLIFLCGQCM